MIFCRETLKYGIFVAKILTYAFGENDSGSTQDRRKSHNFRCSDQAAVFYKEVAQTGVGAMCAGKFLQGGFLSGPAQKAVADCRLQNL